VNYRHAFHAGNFADCMKHALLLAALRALLRKPAPFAVLDTHAGRGAYDLDAPEAIRSGEQAFGVRRLLGLPPGPLDDWRDAVTALGLYPGSPALIHAVLRPQDRLLCCELHADDHAALRARFRGDAQVAVHHRDGWEALRALTPLPERRGLVLIDPPYEQPGEFERLAAGLALVAGRMRGAVQIGWYPIKHRAPVRAFHAALRAGGVRDIVAAELELREPLDPTRLNGCGLAVVNPPFGWEDDARSLLPALLAGLGDDEAGAGWAVTRITDE